MNLNDYRQRIADEWNVEPECVEFESHSDVMLLDILAEQRRTNELLSELVELLRPLADLKIPKFLR